MDEYEFAADALSQLGPLFAALTLIWLELRRISRLLAGNRPQKEDDHASGEDLRRDL